MKSKLDSKVKINESQPWWPSTPLGQGPLGGLRTLREAPPQHLFDVVLSGCVDLASKRICTLKLKTLETTFKHGHFNEKAQCVSVVLACFGSAWGHLGSGLYGGGLVGRAFWHIRRCQKTMENTTSICDLGCWLERFRDSKVTAWNRRS